jgi:Domain of unknown function (DUF4258)
LDYRLSRHAKEEASRRQIPSSWIETVLANPEQRIEESYGKMVLQSCLRDDRGKMYLVRAILATDKKPPVVVAIYRTSKIQKYWRSE